MVRLHSPSRRAPESITNGIMICGSRCGKRYHISLIAIIMLRFLYFRNDTPAHHKLIAKQPPSLAIVSTCIPGPRFSYEYIYVSHINKRDYCEKYNATCILPDQQLETNSNLHKKWDKLYHIKNTLETKPYVDWVLWMDCDAAFTNFDIDWYKHLEKYLDRSKLMVASKDEAGLNLGVFLVPSTKQSKDFISHLYQKRHGIDKRFYNKDQEALKELLEEQPHLKERIGIVKQELINSYIDNNEGHVWSENDFIAHQVFCLQATGCTEKFTSLVKKVTPHFSSYINITRNDGGPSFIYKQHSDRELEPTRCAVLLQQHRAGEIDQTKSLIHSKSYVSRSNTKNTFQISVHSESVDGARFSIFKSGHYYESIMTDVISSIIEESAEYGGATPVMLDVGANVGWFSLLAASYGAEVFAFEPNVINMIRFCESQLLNGWSLAQNLESYNRIHSYLKGVGLHHGERLSMFTPDSNNPGAHTFNIQTAKGQFAKRGKNNGQLQQLEGGELPIVTLDALAKDQGWLSDSRGKGMKITLMKMDIEGAEYAALGGSKELLRTHIIENILIEFNADLSRAEWISQLKILFDCGYEVYKFGGHTGPNKDLTLSSEDPEAVIDHMRNFNYGVKDSNVNVWLKVH